MNFGAFPFAVSDGSPAATVVAQHAEHTRGDRTHDGFFFRAELTLSWMLADVEPASAANGLDHELTGLYYGMAFFAGATPLRGLVIGGGAMANQKGETAFVALGGFAQYYFDPDRGLHAQGFVGYGGIDFPRGEFAGDPAGLVVGGGFGYDFFFVDEGSLGLFARFVHASLSGDRNGTRTEIVCIFPSLGVTATLH